MIFFNVLLTSPGQKVHSSTRHDDVTPVSLFVKIRPVIHWILSMNKSSQCIVSEIICVLIFNSTSGSYNFGS